MILENKKGSSLLIVLIATFILLAIALYLAKLVFNQTRIQNDTTKLKVANYAAESGVERSLYLIRKSGQTLPGIISNNTYNTATLSNNSSYKIITDPYYIPTVTIPTVVVGTPYTLVITSYLSTIRSFTLSWTAAGTESLNVRVARYSNANVFQTTNFSQNYNHSTNSPVTANFNITPINNRIYKFELIPTGYNITDVKIVFYSGVNATGSYVNVLPNQLQRIRSVGNFGNNNRTVTSDFIINGQY